MKRSTWACLFLFSLFSMSLAAEAQDSKTQKSGGRGLTIVQAVEIALASDPAIQLAMEDVAERRAILEQEAGRFDSRMLIESQFTHSTQELVGDKLENERNRRLVLNLFSRALLQTAEEITRAVDGRGAGPIFEGTEGCGLDIENLIFATFENNQQFILCRNEQGEIIDIVLVDGAVPSNVRVFQFRQILDFFMDPTREGLGGDIETELLALLRLISFQIQSAASILRIQFERLGVTPDEIQVQEFNLQLAHQLRFRTGVSFSASLLFNANEENFDGKPRTGPADGDSGLPNTFISTAGLNLNIPLGKGRGKQATGAPELAAEAQLQAAVELLLHTASQRALTTVSAYWRLAATQERLFWLEQSASIQGEMRTHVARLIELDEMIGSEKSRAEARFAEVHRELATARQEVIAARIALAREIGLPTRLLDQAPLATEDLPDAQRGFGTPDIWIDQAHTLRHDLRAASEASRASEILAKAAQINLRPQVDLSLNASYETLYETFEERLYNLNGFIKAWEGDVTGPSYGFGLRWRWPVRNRKARGLLAQAESASAQNKIIRTDLKRTIRLQILHLLDELKKAQSELDLRHEALKKQRKVWKSSEELMVAGESNLIDTLLTEEQLTRSELALIDAKLKVAELEAQLHFESGQLLSGTTDPREPDLSQLRLTLLTPPAEASR